MVGLMVKLDMNNPKANMFGALPCPKCDSEYRTPYKHEDGPILECDCGFKEKVEK